MATSQGTRPLVVAASGGWLARGVSRLLTPWTLLVAAAAVMVGYLAVVPLYFLIQGTFAGTHGITFEGFSRAYGGDAAAGRMLVNTLVYSVGAAGLSFLLGTVLAYVQVRTDAPFKGLFFAASLGPLIIPGILYTPAWIFLADSDIGLLNTLIFKPLLGHGALDVFSLPGMVWVQGLHNAPITFLLMVTAFRGMDPSLEESAQMSGASRWAMLRRITIPLLRPATVTALLLLFVQSVESFEVPALLGLQKGIYVFTSRIYYVTRTFPVDYQAAGAYALLLLGIALVAALGSWWLTRNARGYQTISGKAFRPRPVRLGRSRPLVGAGVVVYFVITLALPLAVLVYASLLPFYQSPSMAAFRSMSLATYRTLLHEPLALTALENSMILSVGAATIVMFLTALVAWMVVRTRVPGRRALDAVTFTPLVIPGLVLGLALLFLYLRVPLPIYGTLLILLICLCTQYLPYGMRFATAAISQVSGELEESALVSGASRWQTFKRVLAPLMSGGILAGWVYILIHSIRSLSTIILLYSPGREVLSVLIFQAYQNGDFSILSAIGIVMIAILVVLVLIAYRVGIRVGVDSEAVR